MLFTHDPTLLSLEHAEQWPDAVRHLRRVWQATGKDLPSTVRLGWECWYILVFFERLAGTEGVDRGELENMLFDAHQHGKTRFWDAPLYLWSFGYMTSLFPYYFQSFDGDFDGWVNAGRNMIAEAFHKAPDQLFLSAFLIDDTGERHVYLQRPAVQACVRQAFAGGSRIEEYFMNLLLIGDG